MQIAFTKYEGAGNDFILIDDRKELFHAEPQLIAHLCDRYRGIGADGLMTLQRSARQQAAMRYFNADGSEGEMCGNGGRCFALFAHRLGIDTKVLHFEAADGLHTARMCHVEGTVAQVELGIINVSTIESGDGWWFVNTGVPHYVEFVEEIDTVDVDGRGRQIRHDTARFAQGTNVNFVQLLGEGKISVRTYERGVEAETQACGTGATAAAIITNYARQHNTTKYEITVPGGELSVQFAHQPNTQIYTDIRLTGAARSVYEGVFDTENF
ncbi:MAG: diaminopimelate epimerase [Alistipes sp.]